MNNIWLSNIDYQFHKVKKIHESSYSRKEEPEDEEMPEDEDYEDEEDGPDSRLNNRQKMMYDQYEKIVEAYGKFDQSAKANGSHYAPASLNPFKEEGMVCGNCVYFIGGGGCEIVSGKIEPMAICKLWIIPQELIKKK